MERRLACKISAPGEAWRTQIGGQSSTPNNESDILRVAFCELIGVGLSSQRKTTAARTLRATNG
jgi:hypothetical protein